MTLDLDQLQTQSSEPFIKKALEAGFPHSKNEDFFYFPLVHLPRVFNSPSINNIDVQDMLKSLPLLSQAHQLVLVDGEISWGNSSPELKNLLQIKDDFTQSTQDKLPLFQFDYFKALSLQRKQKVMYLSIDTHSSLNQKTIQIILLQTQSGTLCAPQFEIELKNQAQCHIDLYLAGHSLNKGSLHIPYLFAYVAPKAQLSLSQTIHTGQEQFLFPYLDVYQEEESSLKSWTSYIQGFKTRIALGSMLAGENAECDLKGFYITDKQEQCEFYTRVYHKKPMTISNQLFKGICRSGGHFSFNGDIIVSEHAKGVEAYQLSKNMITDKDSKVYTRPQLHVSHHELKCTHGATVGGLNPDELFYLQSRGISLEQARHLSMIGFVDEIADTLPNEENKQWAKQLLNHKLGS